MAQQNSNNCDCCAGVSVQTPGHIYNRPGLTAISYRVGTHSQFRQSLLARLSGPGQPLLNSLTTRADDDFTIALLDAWATMADVLTFYQERIANESYLRTAKERLSVLELARLIGYQLRPGVAASTLLAFTLEDAPGVLGPIFISGSAKSVDLPSVTIDIGTRVQSIPGPGEQAQVFETIEKIEARPEWNAVKPRMTQLQNLNGQTNLVILNRTDNNLRVGDLILIKVSNPKEGLFLKKIIKVKVDDDAKTTRIDFSNDAALPSYNRPASPQWGTVNDFPAKNEPDNDVINSITGKSWNEGELSSLIQTKKWSAVELKSSVTKALSGFQTSADAGIFVFRKRTSVFGYNASPKIEYINHTPVGRRYLRRTPEVQIRSSEWPLNENPGKIFLDSNYEEIIPNSFVCIQKPGELIEAIDKNGIKTIDNADVISRTDYGTTAKTTRLTFSPGEQWWDTVNGNLSDIRNITIYAQSERLDLAELPVNDDIKGDWIILDGLYLGIKAGQKIIVTGDRSDLDGAASTEVITVKEVIIEQGYTVLSFVHLLSYTYLRSSVIINVNIAQATNGETVSESLGSGDATQSFQQFVLKQSPLTYISSTTPNGTESTLEIRVNDLLWTEVPSFLDHGPRERIYITRLSDDGKTTVMFGDGITGSRVPAGQQNISARYRKAIGLAGIVKANQLSQLITHPLGVKTVNNPVASAGAKDPDNLSQARRNAPVTVLTLGRIVSLEDYEDFARSFAGIDKAIAITSWIKKRRGVFITVAGSDGAVIDEDSFLFTNLVGAMQKAGDPNVSFGVASYQPVFFRLSAKIQVDAAYLPDKILSAVGQRLRAHFSFDNRQFGQPVHYSEVVSVMQRVDGVTAIDLVQLYRNDETKDFKREYLQSVIPVPTDEKVFGAELLTIDPGTIDLKLMK